MIGIVVANILQLIVVSTNTKTKTKAKKLTCRIVERMEKKIDANLRLCLRFVIKFNTQTKHLKIFSFPLCGCNF